MRPLAILLLLIGFTGAVISPCEIGTEEAPAVGGKQVTVKSRAAADGRLAGMAFVQLETPLIGKGGLANGTLAGAPSLPAPLSLRLRL